MHIMGQRKILKLISKKSVCTKDQHVSRIDKKPVEYRYCCIMRDINTSFDQV